ncbi:MAG: portal protein, partial [Bacteroidales bacterium]|nr:portal protein [Bacteroidales bacterium]
MAEQKRLTAIQRINRLFGTDTTMPVDYTRKQVNKYTINNPDVIFATKDKGEYDAKALELKQNKYLRWRWKKANYQITNEQYMNVSNVVLMYRDADLMDGFPEIGAALDIYAEETTYVGNSGKMVTVESKSERIKAILEDLLYNRLQINMTLPMIARSMCKYGNTYMLFDIDVNNGIKGWRQLPVYEMERYDNMTEDNPYRGYYVNPTNADLEKDTSTKFVWVGQEEFTPYWNWQIAHFRLLYDSIMLPYGSSLLNKARRHWRMLSMMEDGMLLYRLERSWERRVFKINVAAIDEDDVQAYVEDVANEFKRTPVVDPLTGQLDLRKNIMTQNEDFFLPTRSDDAPNPIETLPAAQNLTAIDDIKYILNKVLTGLAVPKPFINMEEMTGDGKNLSLLDVRFARRVNKIQQCLLIELNKACIVHLAFLGFTDDLTNFTLSMNNPSSQAEML